MAGAFEGLSQALRSLMRQGESYAGNIARANVEGAQATRVSLGGGDNTLFVSQTSRDLRQGALADSDSPTHLGLQGEGHFLLFDQSGNLYLTRDGRFHFNANGELVNQQGLWVASFNPGTNQIDKTTKTTVTGLGSADDHVAFNTDGTLVNLSRGNTPGRQLALVKVPNPQGLAASTNFAGTFTATAASGAFSVGRAGENGLATVAPQALEQSNIAMPEQVANLATWKAGFTATAAAMKAMVTALDDILAQFKPA